MIINSIDIFSHRLIYLLTIRTNDSSKCFRVGIQFILSLLLLLLLLSMLNCVLWHTITLSVMKCDINKRISFGDIECHTFILQHIIWSACGTIHIGIAIQLAGHLRLRVFFLLEFDRVLALQIFLNYVRTAVIEKYSPLTFFFPGGAVSGLSTT